MAAKQLQQFPVSEQQLCIGGILRIDHKFRPGLQKAVPNVPAVLVRGLRDIEGVDPRKNLLLGTGG